MKPEGYPMLVGVGDETYRVTFATKLKDGDLGFCDLDMKLIVLSRAQDPVEMMATFWHECLHAMEFELGVPLGHPAIRKLEWAITRILAQFPSESPEAPKKPRSKSRTHSARK